MRRSGTIISNSICIFFFLLFTPLCKLVSISILSVTTPQEALCTPVTHSKGIWQGLSYLASSGLLSGLAGAFPQPLSSSSPVLCYLLTPHQSAAERQPPQVPGVAGGIDLPRNEAGCIGHWAMEIPLHLDTCVLMQEILTDKGFGWIAIYPFVIVGYLRQVWKMSSN